MVEELQELTDAEREQIAKSRAYWNSLGRRLRSATEDRLGRNGISQLERRLKARGVSGGSRSMLNRYLSNDVSPTAEFVVEVARELGISPAWLLTGEGSMTDRRRDEASDEGTEALSMVFNHQISAFMVREFYRHDFFNYLEVSGFRLLGDLMNEIHSARNAWEVVGPWQIADEVLEAVFAPMLRAHARRHLALGPEETSAFNEYLSAVCSALLAVSDRAHLISYDYERADRSLAHEQAVKAAIKEDLQRVREAGDPVESAIFRMTFVAPEGPVTATIGPGGMAECECDEFRAKKPYYCEHLRAAQTIFTRDLNPAQTRLIFGEDRSDVRPLPPLTPAEIGDMKRRGFYQLVAVPDGRLYIADRNWHTAVVGYSPDGRFFRTDCNCGFPECGLIQALIVEAAGMAQHVSPKGLISTERA